MLLLKKKTQQLKLKLNPLVQLAQLVQQELLVILVQILEVLED
jgi:hypothetical protein